jgi:hypothetical protein
MNLLHCPYIAADTAAAKSDTVVFPEVGSCYDRDRPPTALPQDCTVITISLNWDSEKIRLTVRHECFHSEAAHQDASHFQCIAHFDVENRLER